MVMSTRDILLIIFVPLILFLITSIILWFVIPTGVTPVGPTGFTGFTGFTGMTGITGQTGATGMTGCNPNLLVKANKTNMEILNVNPFTVGDITSIEGKIFTLSTNGKTITIDGTVSHTTPKQLSRILGLDGKLITLDTEGLLWILKSKFSATRWEFVQLSPVNKNGAISFVWTTNDQKFLWVTFKKLIGQKFGGILYNQRFKVVDTSTVNEDRIYGSGPEKYVVLNNTNHTLKLMDGYIYSGVAAALLDCYDDLHTISINNSPPLMGLRLVYSEIYTLVVPCGVLGRMNQITNQLLPVMGKQHRSESCDYNSKASYSSSSASSRIETVSSSHSPSTSINLIDL